MSLTADEYRTAAKVAREEDPEGLKYTIESWEDLADRLGKRDLALNALGHKAYQLVQYGQAKLYTGEQLATYLVASGWIPPEALQ